MIYEAEVLENKNMFEYEGKITIKLENVSLLVAYQAPFDFAQKYIRIHEKLPVDLWLVYGNAKKIDAPLKKLPTNSKIAGGIIKGQVKTILSSHAFRVDCGLLDIDIDNEAPIELCENDYIETEGTYQIFFPGTDWARS